MSLLSLKKESRCRAIFWPFIDMETDERKNNPAKREKAIIIVCVSLLVLLIIGTIIMTIFFPNRVVDTSDSAISSIDSLL